MNVRATEKERYPGDGILVSFPFKNKRYIGILGILLLKNISGIRERNPLVALSFHELHT